MKTTNIMKRFTSFAMAIALAAVAAPLLLSARVNGQLVTATPQVKPSSPALPLTFYPVDRRAEFSASLNGTWKFALGPTDVSYAEPGFDDQAWKPIQVPGNWEMQGFEDPSYEKPGDKDGFYRRSFTVPETWKGRRVFLGFEGVAFAFEFFINGKRAGSFASAFHRSEFDITDFVEIGKPATLVVRVMRREKGWEFDTNDDWGLSGIHREVVLFSLPETRVKDYTVTTPVSDDGKASVKLKAWLEKAGEATLKVKVLDAKGAVVGSLTMRGADVVEGEMPIASPQLWTSETPNLYRLELELVVAGKAVHQVTQRLGLRSTKIEAGVFKLNGKPVKFRGITHHDLHPETGRAMTREQYIEDLELMKKASINAIRMSHYPPQKMFLDLCDEYGFYVIDEVPFGFGEEHLTDESYRDVLALRARATVARDKNQTSVLTWTIGNENPYTPLVVETAGIVKALDPSRSRSIAHPTGKYYFELPPEVDIVSPHYLKPRGAAEGAGRGEDGGGGTGKDDQKGRFLEDVLSMPEVTAPVLLTEYAHAAGTSLETFKQSWEVIESSDRFLGGCIWHFQDQGIYRAVPAGSYPGRPKGTDVAPVKIGKIEANTWVAADRVIDTGGAAGADGIVDADRKTTSDYAIVRKVYSAVVVPVDSLEVKPGKQILKFPIKNRYDFINLSTVSGTWELMFDGQKSQSGKLALNAAPRTEQTVEVPVELPSDPAAHDAFLRLTFKDKEKRAIAEHTIRLAPPSGKAHSYKIDLDAFTSGDLQQTTEGKTTTFTAGTSVLQINEETGSVQFGVPGKPAQAFKGLALRVGRTPQMSELRAYPAKKLDFWNPYLLRNPLLKAIKIHPAAKGQAKIDLTLQFNREGTSSVPKTDVSKQSVAADVYLTLSDKGWLDIDYTLTSVDASDYFLELGLALELPAASTHLTWLGEGLFPMVPAQDKGTDRGVYRIAPKSDFDPANRFYPGNRVDVSLAAAATKAGDGLGVACDASTINIEPGDGVTFFTQVLLSAGHGGKRAPSSVTVKASDVKAAAGSLRVVPLTAGQWPKVFQSVLANPKTSPRAVGSTGVDNFKKELGAERLQRLHERLDGLNKDISERGMLQPDGYAEPHLTGYSYKQFYDWDTYFENLYLSYYGIGDYAVSNFKGFMERQQPDGFIQRGYGLMGYGKRQHCKPFLAQTAILASRQKGDDYEWLRASYYDVLKKYLDRWFAYDNDHNGLPVWESCDAAGMDNQKRRGGGRDAFFCEGVDLATYLHRELETMAFIAGKLGKSEDQESFQRRAAKLAETVNALLWDEEEGFYYDRNEKTGEPIRLKSVVGFIPLWAGIATPERAKRLVSEHLTNEKEFWLKYPIATYAATEPDFYQGSKKGECNWQGTSWMPTNYMVFHGLLRYGFKDVARELADRNLKMVLDENPVTREYFDSDTGKGNGKDPFWGWSSLAYVMRLEAELGYDPTDNATKIQPWLARDFGVKQPAYQGGK